jgi:hypothetical protein
VSRDKVRWLLVSLLLHAAVVLLAVMLRPRPAALPVDIELVDLPAPPPAAAVPLPILPARPPAPAVQPPAVQPPAAAGQRATSPRHPAAGGPSTGAPGPGAARQPGAIPPLSLAMRAPSSTTRDLSPSYRVLDEPAATRPATSAPPARSDRARGETTKQRLDRMLAEDRGALDLESGRVHPHVYSVQRDAEGLFRPNWSMVEGDRAGIGKVGTSTAAFLRQLGKGYLEQLRRYAESQRHHQPTERERNDLLEGYNRILRAAEDSADRLGCLVCVTLGRGAQDPRVARSSGRRPFDKLAVEAVKKAARSREAPGDLKPVQACYLVEAAFHRVPPLPLVGCSFDEVKLDLSCYYPTKKMLRSRVRLISVRPLGG